jgi:hypothetical protein
VCEDGRRSISKSSNFNLSPGVSAADQTKSLAGLMPERSSSTATGASIASSPAVMVLCDLGTDCEDCGPWTMTGNSSEDEPDW